MTRKQKRKIAKEIYECELIHQDMSASKEKRLQADDRIFQITNQIMEMEDGLNLMLELDVMIQELVNKK